MPIGAIFSFLGAQEQASATESAANTSAAAQLEAAKIAAAEARFRPVGITTRYGRSNFQFGIPGVKPPVPTDFTTPEEFEAAQSGYEARLASELPLPSRVQNDTLFHYSVISKRDMFRRG